MTQASSLRARTARMRSEFAANASGRIFDRDVAAERGVRRAIHLAHSAGADAGDDFVDTEAGAGNERQISRDYTGERCCEPDGPQTPLRLLKVIVR